MSHASGKVFKDGHVIAHFEYNGTADMTCSCLYDTYEAMVANWRNQPWNECHCGEPPLEVMLYTNYGGGFHWTGQVCLKCRAIVAGFSPFDQKVKDGEPPLQSS